MKQDVKIAVGILAVTGLIALLLKTKPEPKKVIL